MDAICCPVLLWPVMDAKLDASLKAKEVSQTCTSALSQDWTVLGAAVLSTEERRESRGRCL